jgi:hypothetical protein
MTGPEFITMPFEIRVSVTIEKPDSIVHFEIGDVLSIFNLDRDKGTMILQKDIVLDIKNLDYKGQHSKEKLDE